MLIRLFAAAMLRNRLRVLLAMGAIALGVALAAAVHTVNGSAIAEMAQATRMLSGAADLRIEAGRGGFDEALYARVARHPSVAAASPVVEADLVPAGRERPLHVIGIDALRAAAIEPQLVGRRAAPGVDRLEVLRGDTVFLSAAASAMLDPALGPTLALGTPPRPFRVAGSVGADDAALPFAVIDIAAAQTLLHREGLLSRIDLRMRPGLDLDLARRELALLLPPGVVVEAPEESVARGASVSRAYRVNLTVLALVALFTGAFLVFSTSALAVVRRRQELALLRVLGVTRRGVTVALTLEGAAIGCAGSVAGVAMGVAIAAALLERFGGDLGGGFFGGTAPGLRVDALALGGLALAGTLTGAAGALLPALEAAGRAPARAIRHGDESLALLRLPPWWAGLLLLGTGTVLALAPPLGGLPWLGYASIAAVLTGAIALLPGLVHYATRALPVPRAAPLQLALQQVRNMPGYAAAGLASVVISFSLVAAMAVMVVSFRTSLDRWLGDVLAADLYVRPGDGGQTTLGAPTVEALTRLPGVRLAHALRYRTLLLDPARPAVTLIARPADTEWLRAFRLAPPSPDPATTPVWVSEAVADLYGWQAGDHATLPIGGQNVAVTVAGIWRDYARSYGAIVIDRGAYVALTGDAAVNDVALWLDAPGGAAAGMRAAIRERVPDGAFLDVAEPAEIHRLSLRVFDRSFAVTYALEFAALLVGLAGISAHFAGLAYARRREFGMLRHLGMRRREIAAMLGAEGTVIGVLGAAVGLALGLAISLILIYVINRQSFHWGMEMHPPWTWLGVLALALIGCAAGAAVLSSGAAMAQRAVRAVREDA